MDIIRIIKKPAISVIEWFHSQRAKYLIRKQHNWIGSHFIDCPPQAASDHQGNLLLSSKSFIDHAVYKDESWNYIHNLDAYLTQMKHGQLAVFADNDCNGSGKYTIQEEKIVVDTLPLDNNWLCFFLNNVTTSKYIFSFEIEILSDFTEIQVAFRYQDLGNRYRFMIRNNREAVFECVYKGEFYHSLRQIPYRLEHGKKYRISVMVLDDHYQLIVDGNCIFSVKEKIQLQNGSDIAVILWNTDNSAPIKCEIGNISLLEIAENEM